MTQREDRRRGLPLCQASRAEFTNYGVAGAPCKKWQSVEIAGLRLCRTHAQIIALKMALDQGAAKEIRGSASYGSTLLEQLWRKT